MGLKLSRHERVAGLLIGITLILIFIWWLFVVLRQGWFEPKIVFFTKMPTADGIYRGLDVLVSGVKVGQVTEVRFTENNQIKVTMEIMQSFVDKIRKDSVVRAIRPLVIGEKALEISLGSPNNPVIPPESEIPFVVQFDFLSFLSGRGWGGEGLHKLGESVGYLTVVLADLLAKERVDRWLHMFDRLEPLLKNLENMSSEMARVGRQINQGQRLGILIEQVHALTLELNKVVPVLVSRSPDLAQNLGILIGNLAYLSENLKIIAPALKEVGPDLPQATRKALEALNESVILLKAVQKSFLLRSHSEEVRRQERNQEEQRGPATNRQRQESGESSQ